MSRLTSGWGVGRLTSPTTPDQTESIMAEATVKIRNTTDHPIRVSMSDYGTDEEGRFTADRHSVTFVPKGVTLDGQDKSGVTPILKKDWDALQKDKRLQPRIASGELSEVK